MADKSDLKMWGLKAASEAGGTTTLIEVAKRIWKNHELELRKSGDLFHKWQNDMGWAATELRKEGKMGEGWTVGT